MKFKIAETKPVEVEKEVTLSLVQSSDGGVRVECTIPGRNNNLIKFTKEGKLQFFGSVDSIFGFVINRYGKIIVDV